LRGLWSGNKFSSLVDEDKTPDISLDSSDDDNGLEGMDFTKIKLDSDEDEMRIDYQRKNSRDVNNNDAGASDGDESLNMMENIHFAELKIAEVELSDNEVGEKPDDFLPNVVYTMNFSDKENTESDSQISDYNPRDNVKFLSSIESEVSARDKNNNNAKNLGGYNYSSISEGEIKTESVSSAPKSALDSGKHTTRSRTTTGGRTSSNSRRSNKNKYESDFVSDTGSGRTHSNKNSDKNNTVKRRRRLRRHGNLDKSNSSSKSVSTTATSTTNSDSDSRTLSETSSLASDTHHSTSLSSRRRRESRSPSRKNSKSNRKASSKHHSGGKKSQKSTSAQTDFVPNTSDILNFKYPWQQDTRPHNIASHVVDGETLHVLTSYEPAVLAAHDMMKFHFKLFQQHVDNSRRLYQAYTAESADSNYEYTTVEDTMKYIKENGPKVESYNEVLKKIRSKDAKKT